MGWIVDAGAREGQHGMGLVAVNGPSQWSFHTFSGAPAVNPFPTLSALPSGGLRSLRPRLAPASREGPVVGSGRLSMRCIDCGGGRSLLPTHGIFHRITAGPLVEAATKS